MAPKPSTLRIGNRYRPNRLQGPYDAVIIGSGISGLTCGALLSALGKKVLVLEQHYTAGGFTHSYSREGYEWDVGVHYIGDMGAPTMPRRLMDWLTRGQLKWAPMDAVFDRFFFGDQQHDVLTGKQEYRAALKQKFPQEHAAIDGYFARLARVGQDFQVYAASKFLPPAVARLATPVLKKTVSRDFFRTTGDVIGELTGNPDLQAALTGQWGDYGLPPSQSAFIMHALVARHYLHGGFYPVGGSWRMAETIIPRIQAAGGEVMTYAQVDEILTEGRRVRGVRMADGTEIACRTVISSAGVHNTFGRLLPEPLVRELGYAAALQKVTPSMGHLGAYIGLKKTAAELQLPRTNYWVYPSTDYDGDLQRFLHDRHAPFPVVYLSFPSAKDPDFARRHPGRATIEIVAPAPFEWFAAWQDQPWGKRGDDYEALKQALGERLMAVLYEKLPQLKGQVDYVEFSTPLSTQYFNAYRYGELYGLNHDPQRFQQDWLRPRTRIQGLWLTGQDILSCGVAGALSSGLVTALNVAGPRLLPVLKQALGKSPA